MLNPAQRVPRLRVPVLALVLVAHVGLAGTARAQLPPGECLSLEQEVRRCRAVGDQAARLACFESIRLSDAAAPADAAARPGSAHSPASVPASSPSTHPATAAGGSAPASFGLSERAASRASDFLESTIPGAFEGWIAGSRFRLANGQLWEIADSSSASYQLRDPKVRITRGMLGSFFLSIEGVAQSPRVRRIQ